MREARALEPADFRELGLSEEHIEQLFADDSRIGIDSRRWVHRLGYAIQPTVESGLAVPPEYQRLFEAGNPVNAPLPMTGRTLVESALSSSEEFEYAKEFLRDVYIDLGSYLEA